MQAPIDITSKIEIKLSLLRLAGAWAGGAAFVALGYWMTQATEGTTRHSPELVHWAGYAAIAFFGGGVLLSVANTLAQSGPLLTLSPMGLRDTRISPDFIPWHSVDAIFTWAQHGQRMIVLQLHPGAEEKLRLTRMARISRRANARLGADGLVVATSGLNVGFDDLMAATMAYAEAYGPSP
jgi:hypothetical protein